MRHRPEDPVLGHPVFLLEGAHGRRGVGAEDPVFSTRVETERIHLTLKSGDIVTADGGLAQVEGPVAEPPGRFDELAPRLRSDDPVGEDLASLLEDPHALARGLTERSGVVVYRDPEGPQAHLDVGNLL
jgi:hypothetical protein